MFLLLLVIFCLVSQAGCLLGEEPYVSPMLLRVELPARNALNDLLALGLDIPMVKDNQAEVVAYAEDLPLIEKLGLPYQIVHDDLTRFYQSRFPLGTSMGGYMTFSEVLAFMDSLHDRYPAIVSARDSIGYTWQGRALWVFKISDNVNEDENEPEIFFNALIHAREPQSMQWQMYYAGWLCENYGHDSVATYLVDNREIFFLPVVNPDGYEYNRQTNPNGGGMWRKNRRSSPGAVDLNRNWGYMWGYDDIGSSPTPSSETYRGPAAFSEPETQAMRDYIVSRHFSFIVNGHTYGNLFIYPFGYADIYTPDHDVFEPLGDTVTGFVATNYTAGTPWEVLYNVNGEANDWQYGEQELKPLIFCAVIETGTESDGFWPPPSRIPQLNAEMLPLAIFLTKYAENPRAIAPPRVPSILPLDTVRTDTFTLRWLHHDLFNPAVAFELRENRGFALIVDSVERTVNYWQFQDGFRITTARYNSPTHSLFSGDENNYRARACAITPVTVRPNDTLTFYTWYNIERDYDYAYVEVSGDGGRTFTPIPGNITTNTNPHGLNRGNGITGAQTTWRRAIFPLSQFVGCPIVIRFSYETDAGTHSGGIYIDDIFPVVHFDTTRIISSNISTSSYLVQGRTSGTYYYQVRAQDAQGQWSRFSAPVGVIVDRAIGVDDVALPAVSSLVQNYPNPFNSSTTIEFFLARPAEVWLDIYDITGRLVTRWLTAGLCPGEHRLIWDGRDRYGQEASSGVYLMRLLIDGDSSYRRMLLLR